MPLIPAAFAVGSVMHLAEFVLLRSGDAVVRGVVITLVYLHLVAFGAILLSGFWSVVNESFDPREATINRFVAQTNQHPKPFTWTATTDEILAKVRIVQTNIRKLVENNTK